MFRILMKLLVCFVLIFSLSSCGNDGVVQQIKTVEAGDKIDYQKVLSYSGDKEYQFELVSEAIDTSVVGTYTLKYKVIVGGKESNKSVNINIIDTTAPDIIVKNTKLIQNDDIDVIGDGIVYAEDNSKNVDIEIIAGNLDIKVPGEYKVEFLAKDDYGNEAKKEITFTVEEEETYDDIVKQFEDRFKELKSKGLPISVERDPYDGKVTVVYSSDVITKEKDLKYGLICDMTLGRDDSSQKPYMQISGDIIVGADNIFSDARHFYFKCGENVFDTKDEYIRTNVWDYDGGLFTVQVEMIFLDSIYNTTDERVTILSNIFDSSKECSFRLDGSFFVEDNLPKEYIELMQEMVATYLELNPKLENMD